METILIILLSIALIFAGYIIYYLRLTKEDLHKLYWIVYHNWLKAIRERRFWKTRLIKKIEEEKKLD